MHTQETAAPGLSMSGLHAFSGQQVDLEQCPVVDEHQSTFKMHCGHVFGLSDLIEAAPPPCRDAAGSRTP